MDGAAGQQARSVLRTVSRRAAPSPERDFTLKLERLADTWREIDVLTQAEHEEMEKGFRPYGPDWRSMITLENAGHFKVLHARKEGKLIGHLAYSMDFDMEAKGVLIVHQLSWYVSPGHFSVAARMFDWLVRECRRLGVQFLYLSHTEFGRGKTLGKFFARQGAIHTGNTYTMKL
jgi:hypothetical protein